MSERDLTNVSYKLKRKRKVECDLCKTIVAYGSLHKHKQSSACSAKYGIFVNDSLNEITSENINVKTDKCDLNNIQNRTEQLRICFVKENELFKINQSSIHMWNNFSMFGVRDEDFEW